MPCSRWAVFVLMLVVTVGCASKAPAATPPQTTKIETFDRDPGWDGVRNRIKLQPVRKRQNFGWQKSNHAGGSPGEIGGVVWRCVTPAYYGKKLGPFTMDDALSASGTVTVLKSNTKRGWQTGSTLWVGFFNHEKQSWRPINFVGFRIETHTDTDAKEIESRPGVELAYGTSKYAAGGTFLNTTGGGQERNVKQLDQSTMLRVPPDGSKHTWELRYDPKGADGVGEITFVFDGGATSRIKLQRHHRQQGATFDRFGILNNQLCGDSLEAFLDDITINGEKDDFTADPKWDARGNHDLIEDTREYGAQDFGFSEINHVLGGHFQSVDPWETQFQGYYGDRIGPLTFEHKLVASGKFWSDEFSTDSTFAIGWFNSKEQGWPIKNFVGVYFDSLTDVGRIVQPMYGTSEGSKERGGGYVTFLPDGTHYDWTMEYDHAAAQARGAITFKMNGQTVALPLAEGDRRKGATFDHFGVMNLGWANSKHCVVYLDDLTYTAEAP